MLAVVQKIHLHYIYLHKKHFVMQSVIILYTRVCTVTLCMSGPFGDLDEEQVFVQRIIPETDTIFVRLSSDGKRY